MSRAARATSVYIPVRAIPIVTKRGVGLTSGVATALERYVDLLAPTRARIEKEFAQEIPVLALIAQVETWRAIALPSAVRECVQTVNPEEIAPLDKANLLERVYALSTLELYSLGEAIEERAAHG